MAEKTEKITYFAQTDFRNRKVKFGIKVDDRRRHIYVIGKTGMGKSQLLENMIMSDIYNGFGVSVIDPHGDLVEGIIRAIPRSRMDDVIYFNPADTEYPIAFNVLENVNAKHRSLVADGVVGVFKKIWADSWGPRLEYILRNAILALLEDEDSTLLGVTRILTDRKYREKVVKSVSDPVVKYFWAKEFPKYPDRDIATIIGPIQNKVGQYLSNAMIRNIVGQAKSSIDIRNTMDEKKILLLNLSKGRIGEDTSNLLGALMITKLQLAAMSRVDIPEHDRQDFYLYVDELQNFATDSFGGILSEARKYHLNMTMAHQYVDQLPEKLQSAIFGNVGTIISFRVGASDAEILAKEFAPVFTEEDFVSLPKYHIYLKLMIDGVASRPFSASTLPPVAKETGFEQEVIELSRKKYATDLKVVEAKISEWLSEEGNTEKEKKINEEISETVKQQLNKINKDSNQSEQKNEKNIENNNVVEEKKNVFDYSNVDWHNIALTNPELTFDNVYNCDVCGVEMHLEFEPRLDKPILCYKCIKKRDKAFKKEKREREEKAKLEKDNKDKKNNHNEKKKQKEVVKENKKEVKKDVLQKSNNISINKTGKIDDIDEDIKNMIKQIKDKKKNKSVNKNKYKTKHNINNLEDLEENKEVNFDN